MSMDWFDPEEMLRRTQPMTTSPFGGPVRQPQLQEYGNTTPWVMDSLAGAARGLASALEPFQFPQDVMFSLLAGWRDPDKSAVDYFRGDKSVWEAVTAYTPGGDAPARPASGEDILRLFGVEDARAAKWGGIAMDLVADPLIAGAWLKGAGLAAKGMGFADTARDLARLGERADYIMSATPLYRAIPASARKGFEERAFALAQATFNNRVFWNRAEDARTWGDMLLPRRQALSLQMMSGLSDDAGRQTAQFIARTEQVARSKGVTVQEQAVGTAAEALGALGGSIMTASEQRGFVARGMRILGLRQKASMTYEGMPTVLRQYIAKEGWDVIDQRGIAAVMNQLDPRFALPPAVARRGDELMRNFERGVRARATKAGYDPTDAWERAQVFIQKATEADGMLGYHLSGYEYVTTKFQERANAYFLRQGLDPEAAMKATMDTFNDMLTRASRGESAMGTRLRGGAATTGLVRSGAGLADGLAPSSAAVQFADNTGPTVKSILEGADEFSALDIDTFMSGIFNGHMRRSFGIMQDSGSFNRYTDAVRDGKVFLSNVLDDTFRVVPQGYEREFGLLKEFIENSSPGARPGFGMTASDSAVLGAVGNVAESAGRRGTLVSRDAMFAHLMDSGVDAERARRTILEVVKQQNPHLARPGGVLDRLEELRAKLADRVSTPTREGGTFGRGFFRAREDLSKQEMELLGEFANPFISISESSAKARSAVPFSIFMRETYDDALKSGFVRDPGDLGRFKDPVSGVRYVKIPDDEVGIWGAFAGKLVHPFLKKELLNAMKDRGGRVGTWARIRSLVTGGYLASPNVIMANASGGLFQAAAIGLTPDVMIPGLARSLKKLIAFDEKGTAYDTIERMAKYFDMDDSTLIGQNLVRQFKNLELDEAGLAASGIGGFFNALENFAKDQLKRPGIGAARSRWLGLDGFQFVERWFKVSAFEVEYARQLAKGVADDVAERAAAEMARLVVFDYSELPGLFATARDAGILMFPGFNYFLLPRTIRAAVQRPGVLSVSDRMSDALNNAFTDNEAEKYSVYASMPQWLREDQGSIVNRYEGPDGTMRYSVIPTNQLIPTETFAGNPWGESVMSMGLWRPFIEVLTAAVQGDGEALWSAQYGQRVFDPGGTAGQKVSQTAQFLLSNLTPGFVRKAGLDPASVGSLFDPTQAARGLIPRGLQEAFDLGPDMGELMYSFSEMSRGRPDRTMREEVLSATMRAPTPIATAGPLANIQNVYANARRGFAQTQTADRRRLQAAVMSGNEAAAERIRSRILKREMDFMEEWMPQIQAWSQGSR